MKIKIKDHVWKFNCHWYCMEAGKTYEVHSFDEKLNCYIVRFPKDKTDWLVYKTHADPIMLTTLYRYIKK